MREADIAIFSEKKIARRQGDTISNQKSRDTREQYYALTNQASFVYSFWSLSR